MLQEHEFRNVYFTKEKLLVMSCDDWREQKSF